MLPYNIIDVISPQDANSKIPVSYSSLWAEKQRMENITALSVTSFPIRTVPAQGTMLSLITIPTCSVTHVTCAIRYFIPEQNSILTNNLSTENLSSSNISVFFAFENKWFSFCCICLSSLYFFISCTLNFEIAAEV